jgi:flagellin-like protein
MKKLLKSKKALSPVVAAIILIAVTVAVSIAVAAWMGSLTIGFMNTKEAKITAITFDDTITIGANDESLNITVTNSGTSKVNIATIKLNDATVLASDVYSSTVAAVSLPIPLESGNTTTILIDFDWTAGNKYSVSFFETDGTLVGSYTETA